MTPVPQPRAEQAEVHAVTHFYTMSRVHKSMASTWLTILGSFVGTALVSVAASSIALVAIPIAMLLGILGSLALIVAPCRVDVGTDGLLISWLGLVRFVSHADVSDAYAANVYYGQRRRVIVYVVFASGGELALPVLIGKTADDLSACICRAREAWLHGNADPAALVSRGTRSYREWVGALRAGRLGGHRDAAATADALWRVIEDPAARPMERALAAIALDEHGSRTRERLGRTALSVAAPKLRVVLDAVAAGKDEEALAHHLGELEGDKPGRRRRG